MDKKLRNAFIAFATTSALSACFVSSANSWQDQFAQKVCEKALFVSGDDSRVEWDKRNLNAQKCEFTIDQIDGAERSNFSRWFMGVILSSAIVSGVIKIME